MLWHFRKNPVFVPKLYIAIHEARREKKPSFRVVRLRECVRASAQAKGGISMVAKPTISLITFVCLRKSCS
jgi:hypothetical protein